MSLKEWRDNELNKLLMEKWNFGTRKESVQYRTDEGAQSKKDREDESANQEGNQKVSMDDEMSLRKETITVAEAKELAERIFTKLSESASVGTLDEKKKSGWWAKLMGTEGTSAGGKLSPKPGKNVGETAADREKWVDPKKAIEYASDEEVVQQLRRENTLRRQREDLEEATIREVATKVLKRLMADDEPAFVPPGHKPAEDPPAKEEGGYTPAQLKQMAALQRGTTRGRDVAGSEDEKTYKAGMAAINRGETIKLPPAQAPEPRLATRTRLPTGEPVFGKSDVVDPTRFTPDPRGAGQEAIENKRARDAGEKTKDEVDAED